MRFKRGLMMAALPVVGAAIVWGLAVAKSAPARWGADGHRMATKAAMEILPDELPPFLREAGEQLEYLSPEPDRWYSGDFEAMNEAWRFDHYIDLERVPSRARNSTNRYDFLEALYGAGVERPHDAVGFLPFRILELYQRLTTGFASWRLSGSGAERGWIEARILNDAGLLSHYVVDAAQPHHTTIHFNGWAQGTPNLRGFTKDRDFHSQFESGFVRAHLSYRDLAPLMPDAPRNLGDVSESVWDFIESSHGMVEKLYELEKEFGFDPRERPHPETLEFVAFRLAEGAEMLATIWWTAWTNSEDLADQRREGNRGS
jgi:hypothetical protein